MWFLRVLFVISVGHMVLCFVINKTGHKNLIMSVVLILILVGAQLMQIFGGILPRGVQPFFAAYLAYFLGILLKQIRFEQYLNTKLGINMVASFLLLLILSQFGSVAINDGEITNVLFYLIASFAGWILLWSISKVIKGKVSVGLSYVGQRSISIVLLHLISFKIATYLYIAITGGDILLLASYPVLNDVPFLWILYSVVGVIVPIVLDVGYLRCKNSLLNKEK